MKHFLLLVAFLFTNITLAHEVNEAFFNLVIKENTVDVEAEFPWTMRNALLEFNPSLDNSINQKDFEDTFVEYIKNNLILKDDNGKVLTFLGFTEMSDLGHSHQNNYVLRFEGNNLFEVTNTMMFNIFDNQINYTTTRVNSEEQTFKTNNKTLAFKLAKQKPYPYLYLFILLAPLLIFIIRFQHLKRKTSSNPRYDPS